MKCIIVDDCIQNLYACRQAVIELPDIDLAIFRVPEYALGYLKLNPVDLIILDCNMKDMKGAEFILATHKLALKITPKVMICSSKISSERALELIGCGILGYVVKPYAKEQLQKQVKIIQDKLALEDVNANDLWCFTPNENEALTLSTGDDCDELF